MKQIFLLLVLFPSLLFAGVENKFHSLAGFEENNGQVKNANGLNPEIYFVVRGKVLTYFFSDRGYSVVGKTTEGNVSRVDFHFRNNATAVPAGINKLSATEFHYTAFGNFPVNRFEKIIYRDAWDGIDLEFSLAGDSIQRKVLIHKSGFVGIVSFEVTGAEVQPAGINAGYEFVSTNFRFSEAVNQRSITNMEEPRLRAARDNNARLSYLIQSDPEALTSSLSWMTYIGGTGSDELFGITLTSDSGVVITGRTSSADFPSTPGSYQDTFALNYDAIVTRFDKDGNCLWSTFYGGANFDGAYQVITIDSAFVITGMTNSTDLPVLNATQTTSAGSYEAFLLMLNDSGQLMRATYYGGSGSDQGLALAKGNAGEIVLSGSTTSANLPFANLGYQGTMAGMIDAFVAVFDNAFNVQWATYYGGANVEDIHTVTVTPQNEIAFAGATRSFDFPVTPNAWQPGLLNQPDNYMAKFSMSGARLYATFFGGTNTEDANGILGDEDGNLYLTGFTYSADFPTQGTTFQPAISGQNDVFVSRFDSTGQLVWSTFVGGGGQDVAWGMYRTGKYLFICGQTESSTFPVSPNAIQAVYAANSDGFVIKMDTAGQMISGTFMGGNGVDAFLALVVDADTNVFACGNSYSTDLAITPNPFQATNAGAGDGFVVKFGMSEQLISTSVISSSAINSLLLYPNPASDFITIALTNEEEISLIEIVDATGRVVQRSEMQGGIVSIYIADLAPGMYFANVTDNNDQRHTVRFTVK